MGEWLTIMESQSNSLYNPSPQAAVNRYLENVHNEDAKHAIDLKQAMFPSNWAETTLPDSLSEL